MKYRISDLNNFVETAKYSTLTNAARHIGITPPSLSESIKRLESDLNTVLLYRSKSGISLTPNGRTLLASAKVALSEINAVEHACDNMKSFKGRNIIIGCHPVIGSYLLPQALSQFQKKVSDFKFSLKHGSSRQIQSEVQSGQIDIGIIANPTSVPDLVIKKIAKDEVFVWKSKKLDDSKNLICNPHLLQTQFILRKWKNHPIHFIESDSLELITRLTSEGIGYGIIPERAVKLIGHPLVKISDLPHYTDEICLVHRPEFNKNTFEKELIQSLATAI